MDIEKLIEQLRYLADTPSYTAFHDAKEREIICDQCEADFCYEKQQDAHWCMYEALSRAATALSTLRAENSQLRESRDHWKRLAHELSEGVNGKDAEHERLQAENEKLRAELERVKVERDAYQAYFKDLSSKPDCNTCEKRNCEYRPKLGATVRVNCPLYSGPEKDD